MDPPSYLINSCLLLSFVEGRLHHLRGDQSAPHIDLYLLAHGRILDRHVRKTDVLLQKRRRTTRCYMPDSVAIDENFLVVARNAAIGDFKPDELTFYTFLFLACERLAAGEVAFI